MTIPIEIPPIIEAPGDVNTQASGFFAPGTQACFFFSFNDIAGNMYDPYDMDVIITDTSSTTLVESDALDKLEIGRWVYIFNIPRATVAGKYTLTLTYTFETVDGPETETYTEDFVIVEGGTGIRANILTVRQVASRAFVESLIGYTQKIPIYHEPAVLNKARNRCKLTFPRWNQIAGADVYLNGEIMETGYSVQWDKGYIDFTNPVASFDEVWASYNFRWLTDDELDGFVEQGVNEVNIFPPQTAYTLNTIEDRWVIVALYSAAVNVLRRWLMDIQFVEPAKIFGTLQRANDVFSHLESLKRNYEEDKKMFLEQKKRGSYVGQTRTLVTPTFTLPGGRCVCSKTTIKIGIFDLSFEKQSPFVYTTTVKEAYDLFENGKNIQVYSHRSDGTIGLEPISKIWQSGMKEVYEVTTYNGHYVQASEDHLFFVVDKGYLPLKELKIDDQLLTLSESNELEASTIEEITFVGEVETFDIEVPTSENLFANGIKCHNSRWFRYLFKGG